MPILCNGKMVSLYINKETQITNVDGLSLNGDEVIVDDNENIKTIRIKGNYKIIIDDNASVEVEIASGSVKAENLVGANIVEEVEILGVTGTHQCEDSLTVSSSDEIATMSNEMFDDAEVDEEEETLEL